MTQPGRTVTANYAEFHDPRLVGIYDAVCPVDGYAPYYTQVARRLSAELILDIGCGTGLLTCQLATHGHYVIGVEPSALMLERARARCGGDGVTWRHGRVNELSDVEADLAIMTGHVAQFFLEDDEWSTALGAIRRSLVPGGLFVFESRNPLVQPWWSKADAHVDWPSADIPRRSADAVEGVVEYWSELARVEGERVTHTNHYRLTRTGEQLISINELRYRNRDEITRTLLDAGFNVERVDGNWDGAAADAGSPEMIFHARRGA